MRGPQQPYPYGPSPAGGSASAFFALMRSWAVGTVVLLGSQYVLYTVVSQTFDSMEGTESFGWRLVLFHLPTLVCALLTTLAAARVHSKPHHDRPGPHLLACLAVPVLSRGLVMTLHWELLTVEGIVAPTLAVAGGCVIAVFLDMAMGSRR